MKDRLKAFITASDMTQYAFTKKAGLQQNFFKGKSKGMSAETLVKVHKAFPRLNLEYIMYGKSPMVLPSEPCDTKYKDKYEREVRKHYEDMKALEEVLEELKGKLVALLKKNK